jgi:hypothetical protein
MINKRIVTIGDYEDLLYKLYNNSCKLEMPELTENERLKYNLILDFYFSIRESVGSIIDFNRKNKSGLMPILARTVFENSITMTLIHVESEENGSKRFLQFSEVEEYKMFLKYQKLIPEFADNFMTNEELKRAELSYTNFKEKGFSLRDWFGKNLYECCEYLDKNYSQLLKTNNFFTINYLQTYPFLSKSVHGLAPSLENTRKIKGFWPFKKYHVYAHSRDHNISFLYHTTIAFLNSLCILGLATKNEKFYLTHQSLLAKHFNLYTNSLEKRNETVKKLDIDFRKY